MPGATSVRLLSSAESELFSGIIGPESTVRNQLLYLRYNDRQSSVWLRACVWPDVMRKRVRRKEKQE